MKHMTPWIAAAVTVLAGLPLHAATLVLDTFTEGVVNLAPWPGSNEAISPITSPLVDTREVAAYGSFQVWSVTMESGVLTYQRSIPPDDPLSRSACTLLYLNQDGNSFDILGYDAFVLELTEVTGRGRLELYWGGGSSASGEYPIDGAGRLVIPLSGLASPPIENVRSLGFIFTPETHEFKVRIAEIILVPEPSVPVLAASGALLVLLRRRRH